MPRIPSGTVYIRPMPNERSDHQTPSSLGIDAHYCSLLLVERWNWDRYARLCSFIQMTPYEMASLVMMPHKWVDRFKKDLTLPNIVSASRPIALLLTIIEAHIMGNHSTDVIADPFPDLKSQCISPIS